MHSGDMRAISSGSNKYCELQGWKPDIVLDEQSALQGTTQSKGFSTIFQLEIQQIVVRKINHL